MCFWMYIGSTFWKGCEHRAEFDTFSYERYNKTGLLDVYNNISVL